MVAQIVNTVLGIWLMITPDLLGYRGTARTNDHIIGPLVATFACIAIWEATRPVRWVNLPLGAWLVVAPLVLDHGWAPGVNSALCGLVIAGAALIQGEMKHQLGGGWPALWARQREGVA